jgi:hypothetical protein
MILPNFSSFCPFAMAISAFTIPSVTAMAPDDPQLVLVVDGRKPRTVGSADNLLPRWINQAPLPCTVIITLIPMNFFPREKRPTRTFSDT